MLIRIIDWLLIAITGDNPATLPGEVFDIIHGL